MGEPSEARFRFPPVIDATMRSAFLACPHQFFRRHCQGLTPHEEPSIHLHFGSILALGLEEARRQYCRGVAQRDAILSAAEYMVREWGGREAPTNTRTEANKTLENCLLAMTNYFREWPLATDPIQIHYHNNEPCIEFSFAHPIPGCYHPETGEPILYAGRFDLIGDYQNSHWGVDDKSTSALGANFGAQWALRGQFTGYAWGAREWGLPLDGFIIRGIQILTHDTRYEQAISPRPDWMIERWLWMLQRDVARMLKHWNDSSVADRPEMWPQALDHACYSYNRPCEFQPLCNSPHPERWESDYAVRYWDPLTRSLSEPEARRARL